MNTGLNNFGMNNMGMVNNNMMGTQRAMPNNIVPTYYNPVNSVTQQNNSNNVSTNNIIWVQGIEGAKAWQLNPNSMVILLDSEIEGKMYIKVSDNIGMSTLRVFNYVEEVPVTTTSQSNIDLSQYVKKDELVTLIKEALAGESTVSTTTAAFNAATTNATTAVDNSIKQQSEPNADVFAKL